MWRTYTEMARRWRAWRRTRGARLAKAVGVGASLGAMTAALAFLYVCSRLTRFVVALFPTPRRVVVGLVVGGLALAGPVWGLPVWGLPVWGLVVDTLWPASVGHQQGGSEALPGTGVRLSLTPDRIVPEPVAVLPKPVIPLESQESPVSQDSVARRGTAPAGPARGPDTVHTSAAAAEPPPGHHPHGEGGSAGHEDRSPHASQHEAGAHEEAAHEEAAAAVDQGFSVFATLAEAVMHQIGESLGFFEIGHKINEVFIPLKDGDTTSAVSKGAGAATEYSLAVYLVDTFEIMGLIASGVMVEAALGLAGSMAIVRTSVAIGDQVEETTHRSLSSPP